MVHFSNISTSMSYMKRHFQENIYDSKDNDGRIVKFLPDFPDMFKELGRIDIVIIRKIDYAVQMMAFDML